MGWSAIMEFLVSMITVVVAIITLFVAFRAGAIAKFKFGSVSIESKPEEKEAFQKLLSSARADADVADLSSALDFEAEQLAEFYGQIRSQARVAFWFSLMFASIGFAIIAVAVFTMEELDGPSGAQVFAGVIVEAVSVLFFRQSKAAQESMVGFFDALRVDRRHAESRALAQQVEDSSARDALRVRLSLYYAGVDEADDQSAKTIISACLSRGPTATDGQAP